MQNAVQPFSPFIQPYESKTGQNIYLDLLELYDILDLAFRNIYLSYI